ncbi:Ig-like domain-containing protein [Hyalangium gracile]|uniref:Ig-like domain-containing protein n=1 Tax=Hyalangium gracile TaxID=394092 RepID=UPI001CCFCDFB|nr:Ig-like domain-containing protein [Hyalangium gracile]
MQRPIWRLGAALAVALGIIAACGGGEPTEDEPELLLSAAPRQIGNQGQASTITITATNGDGSNGTGTVTLKAAAGALGNSAAEETVTLANGKATTSFTCDKAADPKCAGNVRIDGTWGTATGAVTLTVGSSTTPDGGSGNPDGGSGNPDGGSGNPDGGSGSGDGGTKLTVASSKTSVFTSVGDYAEITATLTGTNNAPKPGESITFDTNFGGLQVNASDTPAQSVQASTDGAGKAMVRLVESGPTGNATVRARHTASGAQASVAVKITNIQQITHTTTTCGGVTCTIMGVKGSGFNEQAQVSFKVVDSTSQPVAGIPVTFSIPNPPTGTTVSPSAVTNPQGIATAIVSSGPTIGAIVVHAVAIQGRVEVDSPNIGIRGAKVSNQGFNLRCDLANIGTRASTSPGQPRPFSIGCDVKVVDRYNNPVGTGTTVNFKVEAGNIPNSVATKAYSPTGNNDLEGTGEVLFNTTGGTPFPLNVTPLPADPNQYPQPRQEEPSATEGSVLKNPRDSLVTVIAYLRGEEYFSDTNNNGQWDSGEQFIDQGEPLVDSNDNGVWDLGETYIDEAPADGQWNGPNGRWDNDTSIWTATYILYSGFPVSYNSYLLPNPWGCVPRNQGWFVNTFFFDDYFNRPQLANSQYGISHSAAKGSVRISGTMLDGYGFGIERLRVNASNNQECTPDAPICIWKTLFYDWKHHVNIAEVKGSTGGGSCVPDVLTVTITTLGTSAAASAPGTLE